MLATVFNETKTIVMKNLIVLLSALCLVFAMPSCSQGNEGNESDDTQANADYTGNTGMSAINDDESQQTILQIAAGNTDFSTLVAAVHATEIEDVLSNPGPITLFAPNNEAFDKLPEGTLDDLLKPENKETLRNILYYHAAPSVYKDNLLNNGREIYEANGDNVLIEVADDGSVTVNSANIIATVSASNGVIHIIDQVLLPPEK